jgi:hypothetical protein
MRRQLALAVAAAPRAVVEGRFERHVSFGRRELTGSDSGGRWGPPGGYSVLYLGRPVASVTVEAYRHLVDPFVEEGMTGEMVAPRRLLICEVAVTNVLDLRSRTAQVAVGLTEAELVSPVGEYESCQGVGRVPTSSGSTACSPRLRRVSARRWPSSSSTCPPASFRPSSRRRSGMAFLMICGGSGWSATKRHPGS